MRNKKYALITGACSGIGQEISEYFAAKKVNLYLLCRDQKKLKLQKKKLEKKYGIYINIIYCDISKKINFNKIKKQIKNIDYLINNSAIANKKYFLMNHSKDYNDLFKINFEFPFFLSQICAQKMLKNNTKSSIINIGSTLAVVAAHNRSLYSSSKHALLGLTKNMALDLARYNICVNMVSPAKVIVKKNSVRTLRIIKKKIPTKKFTLKSEVAKTVFFLCSDEIRNITGENIIIDGGWTII